MVAPEGGSGFLQRFLQLESISLNRKIKVADREAAGEVANRASGEEESHTRVTGGVSNLAKGILLCRGKAIFKKVDVIGHVLVYSSGEAVGPRLCSPVTVPNS